MQSVALLYWSKQSGRFASLCEMFLDRLCTEPSPGEFVEREEGEIDLSAALSPLPIFHKSKCVPRELNSHIQIAPSGPFMQVKKWWEKP